MKTPRSAPKAPVAVQKQQPKKQPLPAGPTKVEKRLENLKAWVVRIKGILAALDAGNMEPAKELARESIEKNNKMIQEIEKFIERRKAQVVKRP